MNRVSDELFIGFLFRLLSCVQYDLVINHVLSSQRQIASYGCMNMFNAFVVIVSRTAVLLRCDQLKCTISSMPACKNKFTSLFPKNICTCDSYTSGCFLYDEGSPLIRMVENILCIIVDLGQGASTYCWLRCPTKWGQQDCR